MPADGPVIKRLTWYWQVEVGNAALVPLAFAIFAWRFGDGLGWPTLVALLPVCGLLVVGGLYWRGKLHALRGEGEALNSALALADRWDRPLLVLTLLALVLAVAGFALPLLGSTASDRWAVLAAAALAVAEYVNYYHRQLQHFDNWPDFKRLITGRGFRPAKMALDLAQWRARRGRGRG
ncbi:hypothetical protein [Erythrobacter oryzae]|uniref:hypothetical protein n=1 Tax=Erythrobacter oryzae TaxID=3019556 RepID=UPI0025554D42|nr:hypothetical protein [Erythrobacter sp. COR-2]